MVSDIWHCPPSEQFTQGAIKPWAGLFLQNEFVEIFGGSNLETLNKQRMEFFISKSCTLYFIELILICAYQHAFHRLSLLSGLESRFRIDMWKCWGNALILCDTTPLLWLYLALSLSTGHRGRMCPFQCHFLKYTSQGLRVYQQYLKIKEYLLASTFIVYC